MEKELIFNLLKERGLNASMIARSLNVTPQAVHRVISEGRGSIRIVKAIAKVCDKDHKTLFPYYLREKTSKEKTEKQVLQKELDAKLAPFAQEA
ncbi:XRE family transcriptional regulator [Ignatzschineria rhizosphaerae]|uniref:XRE family transcriptional regulator n=1 Tax=Ignatzschineria rhizosphaerae TaxID=2923279 RepID=A0ABY3X6R1_9GAMM|nr:XRE family transcriptional regulator [Ignatzschineria rhizosphaerae]UNM95688.1 XRE family transcriptional regulator [Ignatzschineria rhizosphaerae]